MGLEGLNGVMFSDAHVGGLVFWMLEDGYCGIMGGNGDEARKEKGDGIFTKRKLLRACGSRK